MFDVFVGLDLGYPNRVDIEAGVRERVITQAEATILLATLAAGGCPPHSALGSRIRIHGENSGRCEAWQFGHEADVFPGGSRTILVDRWSLNIASNWTNGCIALLNADMQELYQAVPMVTEVLLRVQ